MLILQTILIFVLLFVFGTLAENYLAHGHIMNGSKFELIASLNATRPHNWWKIAVPAIAVSLMYVFTKTTTPVGLVWVFFVLTIFVIFHYVAWYKKDVNEWKEMAMFLPLFIVPSLVLVKMGKILAATITDAFWGSVISVVPWLFLLLVAGIVLVVFLWGTKKVIAVILAIALALSSIAIVAFGVKWPEAKGNDVKQSKAFWGHFYNDDLQKDDDNENDLNFAKDYYQKGMSAKDAKAKHKELIMNDPANGASAMCWIDKQVGTRYMGAKFYDEYEADDAAINAAKNDYINDEGYYKETLGFFFEYLETATVEIREVEDHLYDQMYQIPSRMSIRGVPDVAVFESGEQGGHYLVYIFTIKGKVVEVAFRIECGYQPTNVTEVLNVTVQDKPSGTGGGSNPTPGPEPTTSKPEPTTGGKKDPADDPVNKGNAQKGGGQNRSSDGSGEYQSDDPRATTSDKSKTPSTPAGSGDTQDYEDPMDYDPDPVSGRGSVSGKPPTSDSGDGEFVPAD